MNTTPKEILFIYSIEKSPSEDVVGLSSSGIQFGISYLSACLKASGHNTRLLVLVSSNESLSHKIVEQYFQDYSPEIVAYSAVSTQYPFIEHIASIVRTKLPNSFQVIGGPYASLNPDRAINGQFDAVCIGEGEDALRELASIMEDKEKRKNIKNLWVKDSDGLIAKNETRAFIQDLDAIPFPDREMWKPWLYERAYNTQNILLGRGCPYGCTYCSNHALRRLASGKYVRFRSPENIIREIEHVLLEYPDTPEIFFEVEAIALDKKWFLYFASHLAEYNSAAKTNLKYSCNFRISKQAVTDEVFRALSDANIRCINIGLEAGSERVRREILKRDYTNDDFRLTVELARKYKIDVNLFNMLGIPTETKAEHMETVELNRWANPRMSFTSIFYPYPGTDLYDYCRRIGLLNEMPATEAERRKARLDMPQFTKKQVQQAYLLFGFRIYKGHKTLFERLRMVVDTYIDNESLRDYGYKKLRRIVRHVKSGLTQGAFVRSWKLVKCPLS